MKSFHCDSCGNLVFFENVQCEKCGHALGFLPDLLEMSALRPAEPDASVALERRAKERKYKQCSNGSQHQICNWMVPIEEPQSFCAACRLNEIIPDLTIQGNLQRWHKMELAKRRVLYTLSSLCLPIEGQDSNVELSLKFRFLGDPPGGPAVATGHDKGIITVNIAEADDHERERRRVNFNEPYRALLGHLRHEVAHFYWDRLIARSRWLSRFRELFGAETSDYGAALKKYYQSGPPSDWQKRYISAYASAHPWEDWAETGAHYFHIHDTLETAASSGLTLKVETARARKRTFAPKPPSTTLDAMLQDWVPLTCVLNNLNRSMGLPDLYPFIFNQPTIEKLQFVHEVIQFSASTWVSKSFSSKSSPDESSSSLV